MQKRNRNFFRFLPADLYRWKIVLSVFLLSARAVIGIFARALLFVFKAVLTVFGLRVFLLVVRLILFVFLCHCFSQPRHRHGTALLSCVIHNVCGRLPPIFSSSYIDGNHFPRYYYMEYNFCYVNVKSGWLLLTVIRMRKRKEDADVRAFQMEYHQA